MVNENPNIPAVPADVETCAQQPVVTTNVKLTAGEVEKLWKTDRFRLAKLNGCFHRLICQYHEVRKDIGGVSDERVCGAVPTEYELRRQADPPIPRRQKRLE